QVVEIVDPVRSLSHSPIFQVMFSWMSTPRSQFTLPGLTLGSAGGDSAHARAMFDLLLALQEAEGRIVGGLTYATALFERESVERYIDCLRRVLEAMVADDSQRLEDLPLLPERERARVLDEWNRHAVEYAGDSCAHELFDARAERTPDAIAAVVDAQYLTYA